MSVGEHIVISMTITVIILLTIRLFLKKEKNRNKQIDVNKCKSCEYELGIFEALELKCPSCGCDM